MYEILLPKFASKESKQKMGGERAGEGRGSHGHGAGRLGVQGQLLAKRASERCLFPRLHPYLAAQSRTFTHGIFGTWLCFWMSLLAVADPPDSTAVGSATLLPSVMALSHRSHSQEAMEHMGKSLWAPSGRSALPLTHSHPHPHMS